MLQRFNDIVVYVLFFGFYFGLVSDLLMLIEEKFLELGFKIGDCREMSWIELVFWFIKGELMNIFMECKCMLRFFKGKDDFI